MEIEKEVETIITLNGNYSVDVYVDGEFEWDLATTECETEIRINEQE
jgi:hypothetical protein